MNKKPKIDEFKKVCNAKGGIISSIAASFNVERKTVYNWTEKDPRFREAVDSAGETFLDITETNLQTLVKGTPKIREEDGKRVFDGWEIRPSESAIIFVLRTKGKKRGYIEKTEHDHTTNGKDIISSIQVEVIDSRDKVMNDAKDTDNENIH